MMSQAHRSGGKPTRGNCWPPYPSSSSSEEFRDYLHHSSGIAKSAYLSSEVLARIEDRRLLFTCSTIFEQNLCHRRTIVAHLFRRVKEKEGLQMATDSNTCHDFEKLVLTLVFICMLAGLLFQNPGAQYISSVRAALRAIPAEDLSVVRQPSLPAATVDAIFKRLGSPMAGTGQVVVQASLQANIDDAFALAVWWVETNDGAAGVGLADRNPGSVRGSVGYPSAFDGYTIYPSYSAAIVYWFHMLRNVYVNHGLSTVYALSYRYVGTSNSPVWAGHVVSLILKYRGEAPPAPTAAPSSIVQQRGIQIASSGSMANAHTNTVSLANRTRADNMSQRSSMVQQVNALPTLPLPIEFTTIFFALLLALGIVVWALTWEKRQTILSIYAPRQNMDAPNTDALGIFDAFNELADAPATDTLGVAIVTANIRVTDSLPHVPAIPTSQNMTTTSFDGSSLPNIGTNLRIRGTILLPSVPLPSQVEADEIPVNSIAGRRSTGLLSRYSETHQG
jgi:hypothetical protein